MDITNAFTVLPVHPDLWRFFGVCWRGAHYFAVRLTFGYKSSPKIFNTLSETVCWILLNNHNISFLVRLLDNFLIISPPSSPQRKQRAPPHPFSSLESLLTQICFRLHSQSKSCDLQFPPCPVLHQSPISLSPRPPQLHPMYYSPRASIHLSFAIYPHLL